MTQRNTLSNECTVCFSYGCPEHSSHHKMSADAGFLCNQAGVLSVATNETLSINTVFCLQVHWSTLWAPLYFHLAHPATSCVATYTWQGFSHIYSSTPQHPTNRSSQSFGTVLCIRKHSIMNE